MVRRYGIAKLLRLRQLIRLAMDLRTAVCTRRLALLTNGTVWVLRKMGKAVMLVFLRIEVSFLLRARATPTTSLAESLR